MTLSELWGIFLGMESKRNPSKYTNRYTPAYICPSQRFTAVHLCPQKSNTASLITTYSRRRPPSHPLHRCCCLVNPPPLRCGQAQILGVLVLLNSGLKSLAGLAHRLQNVWTQLKTATSSQHDPLSRPLCRSHRCARM